MIKFLLRIAFLGFAALVTLVVLFYAWTDWAGARHWKAVEASMRAKGEPLTIADITHSPIPDELNFAAAPIFAEIVHSPDPKQWRISALHNFLGAFKPGSSTLANAARAIDRSFAGSGTDAAKVILGQTTKWKPLLDEVREAAKRPGTVWPPYYGIGTPFEIGHTNKLITLGQIFFAEAEAYLQLQDTKNALSDFQLLLNLSSRCQARPLIIDHLVGIGITDMAVGVARFGIERHTWHSADLETMQDAFANTSVLLDLAHALAGERTLSRGFFRIIADRGYSKLAIDQDPKTSKTPRDLGDTVVWWLYPRGWVDEDLSNYWEKSQQIIDWLAKTDSPRPACLLAGNKAGWPTHSFNIRTPFSAIAILELVESIQRTVYNQAKVNDACVACAIERYRIADKALPPTLASLQPDFLSKMPRDPMNGQPFHYRVTGKDSYLIYSVGWNGIDDHGSAKKPSSHADAQAEDWVWNPKS